MANLDSECLEAARTILPLGATILNIDLHDEQIQLFGRYCSLLIEANQALNLTAITDPTQVMRKHILDSLTVIPAVSVLTDVPLSVVDVGTGGGMPGLALAVLYPNAAVTVLDSIKKKITFIESTCVNLRLSNVEPLTARVEDFARREGRDRFDLAVARALASTQVALEYCAPLVRPGGQIALYKSGEPEIEQASAQSSMRELNCRLSSIYTVPPSLDIGDDRFVMVFDKVEATPDRYPRRVGVARSRPL